MTPYNLLQPSELAEFGLASSDRLAQHLGASLQDHVDELELLYDGNKALTERIADLERTVHELEAHNAYLRGMVAGFQDLAKKKG